MSDAEGIATMQRLWADRRGFAMVGVEPAGRGEYRAMLRRDGVYLGLGFARAMLADPGAIQSQLIDRLDRMCGSLDDHAIR